VIVAAAFRRKLDGAQWWLAIAALANNLLQCLDDASSLGNRWTHWNFHEQIAYPMVTIVSFQVSSHAIAGTLLFVAILWVAWRYTINQGARQSAMERELHSAREVQRVLVPEAMPELPGYTVGSAYLPAQEVGGDFFQVIDLPKGAVLVVIGDVSGKGLPAAMAVALIVGAIRSTVETTDDPAEILAALNRRLHGRLRSGFATCVALRLDTEGNGVIANAGHLPPYVDGEEFALPSALPLGLVPEATYEAVKLSLKRGSLLTLYTDGLLEARNAAGELFGFERTKAVSRRPAEEIVETARKFGQEDDITVLTLLFDGAV
jgi:serine phosphatase RsbU (regulator of sigma subunit)